MKHSAIYAILLLSVLFGVTKTSAQSANKSLSNLTSPTKINTNLLPGKSDAYDLGSSHSGWRNLYLTGSVSIDGKKFITHPGFENSFFGTHAGFFLTTGQYNTAVGFSALYGNTSGSSNTVVGAEALFFNSIGNYNVALGNFALYNNTSGSYNAATGTQSLYSNVDGSYNTANGHLALGYNTSGSSNTANGYYALLSNTTGTYNSASGAYSLYQNTTAVSNTAGGVSSMYSNTTGSFNTAHGTNAAYENTTGSYNTADGMDALFYNTTGNYNTGIGYYALLSTTSAYYNTAVGYNAGYHYNNGFNNVFLGANTDVNGADYYNDIAIGQGTICTDVNQARIGNSATKSIGGYANWTNISDGRVKRNIQQNVPGLTFINKLQPVTYNLDLEAADRIIQAAPSKDKEGKIIEKSQVEITARKAKEQVIYTGFVAQDVEKAAKSLNFDFSGVDAAKNDKDLYGLRYAEFVVPLVKAVQELSKMNEEKDTKINDLQKQINDLKTLILAGNGTQLPAASLSQNTPNPFNKATSIHYSLPQTYSSAKIIITDSKGAALKQYDLNAAGSGSVQVDALTLASGAYSYTLYVNGRMIDTKQMISEK